MELTVVLLALTATVGLGADGGKKPKYTGAPGADLSKPIIWGNECATADGGGLRFGGIDQKADDGAAHTEVKVDGQWVSIIDELRKGNPRKGYLQGSRAFAAAAKLRLAGDRFAYLDGKAPAAAAGAGQTLEEQWHTLAVANPSEVNDADTLVKAARQLVGAGINLLGTTSSEYHSTTAEQMNAALAAWVMFDQAADLLDCEPAPRAIAPIAYDAKTKLFVIFGGDHLDYMSNDTWVFDPSRKRWEQRHPKTAPPPRANHTLKAEGDGKVKLSGGIGYNNTDIGYMGPAYQFLDDGDWTYDIGADTWTSDGGGAGVSPDQRAYRTYPGMAPESFLKGDKPDAAANEAVLKGLPVNTWVAMHPPVRPKVNRDWGSACIAPDKDVLLRWSGGHCAHGGSDVPMYHFATNRWEMPFPVELPLGQCYSNTSYPEGFNFNRRPWVSGHTYKNFGYDPVGKVMVFTGHSPWFYMFDPAVEDWIGRGEKPAAMCYGGCFYTLTVCATDKSLYCWGGRNNGTMHLWNSAMKDWEPLKVTGAVMPHPEVDHCGLAADCKRDRLILLPKTYKGSLFALDCKSNELVELKPDGENDLAKTVNFWRECAYLPDADMIINAGATVAGPDAAKDAPRLTLCYDCANNKWMTYKLAGPHTNSRDVSYGSCYDARRKLVWVTDTGGEVFALRFDPKAEAK